MRLQEYMLIKEKERIAAEAIESQGQVIEQKFDDVIFHNG